MAADLREGSELAGYRIQALVARGGMGVVYRATQLALEREVALKVIAPEFASQQAFRERFLREAKMAASLEHPHVLPVYEAGEVDGQLFLALRYVEGADLDSILADGHLAPERVLRIMRQLCSALEAAHRRGLVHRDVKPANVLLLGREDEEHVYLTDFGLAKPQKERGVTKTGDLLGSVDYLAPEQIESGEYDERSDLYALGCLLYACLTGKPPFHKEHETATLWAHLKEFPLQPSKVRPELGDSFDRVIERALAKNPADRFQSAGEFSRALVSSAPAQQRGSAGTTVKREPTSSRVVWRATAQVRALDWRHFVRLPGRRRSSNRIEGLGVSIHATARIAPREDLHNELRMLGRAFVVAGRDFRSADRLLHEEDKGVLTRRLAEYRNSAHTEQAADVVARQITALANLGEICQRSEKEVGKLEPKVRHLRARVFDARVDPAALEDLVHEIGAMRQAVEGLSTTLHDAYGRASEESRSAAALRGGSRGE